MRADLDMARDEIILTGQIGTSVRLNRINFPQKHERERQDKIRTGAVATGQGVYLSPWKYLVSLFVVVSLAVRYSSRF